MVNTEDLSRDEFVASMREVQEKAAEWVDLESSWAHYRGVARHALSVHVDSIVEWVFGSETLDLMADVLLTTACISYLDGRRHATRQALDEALEDLRETLGKDEDVNRG